jgi:hypothetical protein
MLLSEYDQSAVRLADAAMQKVVQFHYSREFNPQKQLPPKGMLFHYTSAEGLKGIIEKNELWATSAYYLNDSTEITYGYALLKEVLDDWMAENLRDENSLSLGIARDFQRSFGVDLLNMGIVQPIYLACFCEEDNLLSQWRTYGQSGGYSLGFRLPAPELFTGQGFKPEPNTFTSKWVKVDYDRNEQVRKCRALLDPLLAIFDDRETAQAMATIGAHPLLGYAVLRRIIVDILMEEIVGFKNPAFEIEQEWRVVVRQRELTKQGTDDGGKTLTPVHFRSSKGMLVPYVKIIPTDPAKKLPIACVRSGPTLDKNKAGMAVCMMLEANGFPSVPVEGSHIPVTF